MPYFVGQSRLYYPFKDKDKERVYILPMPYFVGQSRLYYPFKDKDKERPAKLIQ